MAITRTPGNLLDAAGRWVRRCGLLSAALLLVGCSPDPQSLEAIIARGTLNVATINGPTTFYQGAHGPQGAQYSLATAFASSLGLKLNLYAVADMAALREELLQGRADIIAADITPDEFWSGTAMASEPYEQIDQLVVMARGSARARGIDEMADQRIAIPRDSAQLRMLEQLRAQAAPNLQWDLVSSLKGEPIELVSANQADFAIIDATLFAYLRHLFPDIVAAFSLPQARSAHWLVSRHSGRLLTRINAFFADMQSQQQLTKLLSAATPASPEFELQTSQRLQKDIESQLPALRPHFEEAGGLTGVDWRLLAALGYAESRWQTTANSADGASGIMMLTRETAATLGVSERGDARQNILAGARYFVQVRDQIPERIAEPERTWFALAAYNVGYGHLEDARRLAQSRGGNPDRWIDVSKALPLLAMTEYYEHTRHGFARGWEPAHMVEQVQLFLKLLEWKGEALANSRN